MANNSYNDGRFGCFVIFALIGLPVYFKGEYGLVGFTLCVVVELLLIGLGVYFYQEHKEREKEKYKFRAYIEKKKEFLKTGEPFDAFVVKISGDIIAPTCSIMLKMRLFERTKEGEQLPVISSLDIFQEEDITVSFSKRVEVPSGGARVDTPAALLPPIPISFLTFSRKGILKLECEVSFSGIAVYGKKSIVNIIYDNKEDGYLDNAIQLERTYIIATKLAVLLSRCDGDADKDEADFIKEYVSSILERARISSKSSLKDSLNTGIKEAFQVDLNVDDFSLNIDVLCDEAKDFSLANKMKIINFLLKLSAVDGVAKKEEFNFIEYVVGNLKVDYEEYRKIRDKIIDLKIYEIEEGKPAIDAKSLLAISDDMSVGEIKSILNKEYRKWNSLQHSKDESTREQAKNMIKLIAEERKNLKNR